MTAFLLRAEAESGEVILDPSEDVLFMMFEDVESGDGTFLMVERISDSTRQTYAQAQRHNDGSYVVEYRDGGPDRHFGTTAPDMRGACELVTGWAFDLPGWRDSAIWVRVVL